MYLIMPDRFANGDPTNDDPDRKTSVDRTTGRLLSWWRFARDATEIGVPEGLGGHRDLDQPRYTTTTLNNGSAQPQTGWMYDGQPITDYHGYGATDFYGVEEHFGSLAQLKTLVDDAHRHGIKIVLDMVANHSGPYHPWVKDPPTPSWYHGTEADHPNNDWQTWTLADPNANAAMRRSTLDGWFVNILPDFNQDDPEVARYIIQNTLWWVGVTGMDGIRQDTWPYVPRSFWRDWMAAIKKEYPALKVVGEVLDGDPAMIAFFEGSNTPRDGIRTGVDMMFDFPLHFTIRNVFARGESIRQVAQLLAHDQLYDDPTSLVTLLGLHDVQRFMHEPGATIAGLKLAYTLLLTQRGTPLIYYGDEIAMPGGNDPDNRRDFPGGWRGDPRNAFEAGGRTPEQQDVFRHVQALLKLRGARPDLRAPSTTNLFASDQAYVYRRGASVIALNNDSTAVTVRVDGAVPPTAVIGACAAPVQRGAETEIVIPARSSCVF